MRRRSKGKFNTQKLITARNPPNATVWWDSSVPTQSSNLVFMADIMAFAILLLELGDFNWTSAVEVIVCASTKKIYIPVFISVFVEGCS
jgi:hypothetical protein